MSYCDKYINCLGYINEIIDVFRCSQIREGIIRCILATDMARHNEILTQFQEVSPNFDYSNEAHINLVSATNFQKRRNEINVNRFF